MSFPMIGDIERCAPSMIDLTHVLSNVKTLLAALDAGSSRLGGDDELLVDLLVELRSDLRRAGDLFIEPIGRASLLAMADQIAAHRNAITAIRARWATHGDVLRVRLADAVDELVVAPAAAALREAARQVS